MKTGPTIIRALGSILLTGFLGISQAADFTVNQVFDGADADPGDGMCATEGGSCTLRAAVMETNALAGADTISIPAGTYSLALGNTGENLAAEGDLDILDDLTITGEDADTTTIDGNGFQYRIFSILKRVDDSLPIVVINKLTLTQGLSDPNGALIFNEGELSLDDITLTDAGLDSRAMVNESNFTISNSRVTGNESGIYSSIGNGTIINSEFSNNISDARSGVAFYLDGGTLTISNTIFSANESIYSGSQGGAIYQASPSSLYINNSQFIENKVMNSGSGGAIYSWGNFKVSNSSFEGNEANDNGGALLIFSSGEIVDSTFSNNIASADGGGIYTWSNDLIMKRLIMSGNQAISGDGGALFGRVDGYDKLILSESIISNNTASDVGGGIALTNTVSGLSTRYGEIFLRNSEISNNTATSGGGLSTSGGNIFLANLTVAGNTATIDGGGLYHDNGSSIAPIELTQVSLANNISPVSTGSNITSTSGIIRLNNTLIADPVDGINCSGSITTLGYNLSSDTSCGLGVEGDQSSTNPLLTALADNGGFTQTMALQTGSPAIDGGSTVTCATLNPIDQRFFYRSDAICDIGAYEADSVLAQTGTLAFSASDYIVNEADVTATITFSRTGGSEGIVSVPYFDNLLGSAEAPDYDAINSTRLEWADGDSSDKTLEITINDDISAEDDETILLQLESDALVYGGASLGLSSATVTIVDDDSVVTGDGELQFADTIITVNEADGSATATVTRANGTTGTVTVDYIANFDSLTSPATIGTDFNLTAGTLTFADGVSSQTITFSIIGDVLQEDDEDFWIDLSNPTGGATLGAGWFTGVTITDNDGSVVTNPGTISIENSNFSVSEGIGSLSFDLVRTGGTDGDVQIDLDLNDGSAVFGNDYGASSGGVNTTSFTLTFLDGVSTRSNTISILEDNIDEGTETFTIVISNPQGGATMGTLTATVSITDNDSSSNSDDDSDSESGGAMHPALLFGLFLLTAGLRRRKQS